jgi:hypothetical protein
MLAKKMESIDYNPFGKIGGGAPNMQRYNIREVPNPPSNERNF